MRGDACLLPVCVRMWVREREKGREGEREREREKERERERKRKREKERERKRERDRKRECVCISLSMHAQATLHDVSDIHSYPFEGSSCQWDHVTPCDDVMSCNA